AKGAKSILLPYQMRWLADRAPVKVAEKSRRVGITWTEAADSALHAAARDGTDTWYLGYNKDMALEFVETAAAWARQLNKAARAVEEVAVSDEQRDILAYRVRFNSGRKIVALSSRPSNLRGKQGRAVIDEAAFHDDLRGLLKAALAFTLWGGQVRVISTHNGAANAFNELVNDIRAGRKRYSLHRVTIEDAIGEGLFHRICAKSGRQWSTAAEAAWREEIFAQYGEDAEEELRCVPRASGGTFLASLLIEERMCSGTPVARWAMPAEFARQPEAARRRAAADFCAEQIAPALEKLNGEALSFVGEDFGRSGDLTVIWPLQLTAQLRRHTPFVVELRNIPFTQQEEIFFYIADRLPRFSAGALDARGNGQFLAERAMQRYGAKIQQVMLTAEWYRENMPRYKAAFEDGLIDLPRDAAILDDHRSLVVERGVARAPERRGHDNGGNARHSDSAIAGALAYYASTVTPGAYEYLAAGRARPRMAADEDEVGFTDYGDAPRRRGGRLATLAGAW
ncbi:MAG: terminase large subunit domain-containing protein, partial [Steroidobacteraceae bacterium]